MNRIPFPSGWEPQVAGTRGLARMRRPQPTVVTMLLTAGLTVSCGGVTRSTGDLATKPADSPPKPVVSKPLVPEPALDRSPSKEVLDSKKRSAAQVLVENGRALFKDGRYREAEIELKKAIQLYPFLAEANLWLGKVFLIHGAAKQDTMLIESARLMFQMSKSIDPNLREADILLGLFPPAK